MMYNMFIYTENYTESHTNIKKQYNTKHTQNTPIHFQQSIFFQKYISWGLPGPPWTAFELKTDLPTSKNHPDATTLTSHALDCLKRPQNIKICFREVPCVFVSLKYIVEGHTA